MNENELFDLKYHIADFILPRLIAFKNKIDKNEAISIPVFEDFNDLSFEQKELLWSEILEKMIFPFEYLSDPNKFINMDSVTIRQQEKIGLEYFSKYFENLWF